MYLVKHETEMSKQALNKLAGKVHQFKSTETKGRYYVVDHDDTVYGQYDDYDDALDHAETLNEMEEL